MITSYNQLIKRFLKIGELIMTNHYQGFDNIGDMMADRGIPNLSRRQKSLRETAELLLKDYGFKRVTFGMKIVTLANSEGITLRISQERDIHEILNSDGSLHSSGKTSELIRKLNARLERKMNESQVN